MSEEVVENKTACNDSNEQEAVDCGSADCPSETMAPQVNAEAGNDAEDLVPLLEALLLSSSDPVDMETLARVCEVDQDSVGEAIKILTAKLESDSYGFNVIAVAKGFQFRTKPQFARYIRTLKQESPRKLSPAALETLAVIAYRQPVVKHDIDGLRGVDVMPTLKTLLERGLIQVVGHRETVGHPSLYGTTEEFLRVFGLNSITDLPTVKELNHMQVEPGEHAETSFDNPLASFVKDDVEHVTSESIG